MMIGFLEDFSNLSTLLPQDRHHVLGYIHRIDTCFTYLSYYYRSRERDIGEGKYYGMCNKTLLLGRPSGQ